MQFKGGPYIQVAAFCDQVIEDKTGALSLIRIIDTLTHTVRQPEPPSEMPQVSHTLKLVLGLKSGQVKGKHELKVVPESPSGELEKPLILNVELKGKAHGHNHIVDILFVFSQEGLYWFNVYFDDALLTRLPFRVNYVPVKATPTHTA